MARLKMILGPIGSDRPEAIFGLSILGMQIKGNFTVYYRNHTLQAYPISVVRPISFLDLDLHAEPVSAASVLFPGELPARKCL